MLKILTQFTLKRQLIDFLNMFFVFISHLANLFTRRKILVLLFISLFGIIVDYQMFTSLGKSSIILIILFFVIFLYEKKFRKKSYIFQLAAILISGLIYQLAFSFVNFYQIFWYSFLYLFIVYFKLSFFK